MMFFSISFFILSLTAGIDNFTSFAISLAVALPSFEGFQEFEYLLYPLTHLNYKYTSILYIIK